MISRAAERLPGRSAERVIRRCVTGGDVALLIGGGVHAEFANLVRNDQAMGGWDCSGQHACAIGGNVAGFYDPGSPGRTGLWPRIDAGARIACTARAPAVRAAARV